MIALAAIFLLTSAVSAAANSTDYDANSPNSKEFNSSGPNSTDSESNSSQTYTEPAERETDERKPFQLRARRTQTIERPYWIPARAYAVTDDTTHYRWVIGFITIEKRLPNHPTTTLLSRSTSKHWRGFLPRPCYVRILPDRSAPEGNFIFFTVGYKNGPRGWLQYAGPDKKGRPHYRYWFDPL